MGIPEDMAAVESQLDAQEQWGNNVAHRALRVMLRAVRAIATRADTRADALEQRVSALENRLP